MTTPNTPPAPDAAAQGSHHSTRHDVFVAIRQHVTSRFPDQERATVAFFALEPNQL